ncbi:DUF3373 family protein [Nitratiruptor sp. YY09-18]|uniref:DUF3373 family protein n=1 Tax=Nitratiruptor sp. YY09-18 TaxID=2724901 RepID=UPI0019160435|nr:DUF3373 family protein [Nitratiruptor sp. YY09-18]BCD68911.1 hypothetical protein NitYY0918_C1830 [Nitratiruptor sp. YY09-18]
MKKFIALSAVAAMATVSFASGGPATSSDDLRAELEQLKAQIAELKEAQSKINIAALKKQIREVKAHDAGDNIKWNVDFRTAYDVIGYKNACPDCNTNNWNQIFTNRLWLGMGFAPTSNLVFKGLLSYYKMYGQLARVNQGFNYFDWIVNETPNPAGELRVKEAYWLYLGDSFLGSGIPWTASLGRRPATDGLLINYREDQDPKSPLGHIINTEFDGASFKFKLGDAVGVPGMYFKLCMGRGMTNAHTRYYNLVPGYNTDDIMIANQAPGNYRKANGWNHTDLFGFIFVPYDDGQYSVHTTAFKAWNMPGMVMAQTPYFAQVGDYYGAAISLLAQGIGDGINDFLDDTNAFVSFAWSKTDPKGNNQMQGFYHPQMGYIGAAPGENKTGNSIYAGVNFPLDALISGTRMGLEYNHGSKYWRSMTYAEDTLAGSKMATRGNAYDVWINKDLIGKALTAQVRYTYMDYDYTGSNGFFGAGSAPVDVDSQLGRAMNAMQKAQDIRVYLRYRY